MFDWLIWPLHCLMRLRGRTKAAPPADTAYICAILYCAGLDALISWTDLNISRAHQSILLRYVLAAYCFLPLQRLLSGQLRSRLLLVMSVEILTFQCGEAVGAFSYRLLRINSLSPLFENQRHPCGKSKAASIGIGHVPSVSGIRVHSNVRKVLP